MRLRAAGQRPISNVVDVSNYVMLELGKPIHTYDAAGVRRARRPAPARSSGARRPASGSRPSTTSSATLDPDTLLIADHARAARDRRGHGRRRVGGERRRRRDVIVESAIFDPISIRRTGQRYASAPRRASGSRRARSSASPGSAPIATARLIAEWAGGSVARGRVDTRARRAATGAGRRSGPARVNRLLGHRARRRTSSGALLARVGDRDRAGADRRTTDHRRGRLRSRSRVTRRAGRRDRRDRPDVAPRHRDRGRRRPRRSPASAATRRSRRSCPTRRCRRTGRRRSSSATAIRETLAGAGLTEVVSHALVSPRLAETFRWSGRGRAVDGGTPAGGRLDPRSRTRCRPITRSCGRRVVGSLVEIVVDERPPRPRRRRDLRDRQGLRPTTATTTREWWRLALALTGAAEEPRWNRPRAAVRPRRREGRDRARLPAARVRRAGLQRADAASRSSIPGRARAASRRTRDGATRARRRRRRAPSERRRRGRPARRPPHRRRARHRGSRRRAVRPTVRAVAPPRHPAAERDLAIVVPETVPAGGRRRRRSAPSGRPGARLGRACSTSTAARRSRRREEPRLAPGVPGRRIGR